MARWGWDGGGGYRTMYTALSSMEKNVLNKWMSSFFWLDKSYAAFRYELKSIHNKAWECWSLRIPIGNASQEKECVFVKYSCFCNCYTYCEKYEYLHNQRLGNVSSGTCFSSFLSFLKNELFSKNCSWQQSQECVWVSRKPADFSELCWNKSV